MVNNTDILAPLVRLRLLTHNKRLLDSRAEKGWTQAYLAMLTDIHPQRISAIESLKRIPTVEQAREIADALEKDVEWLFPPELGMLKDVRREAFLNAEQISKLSWIKPLELPEPSPLFLRHEIEQSMDKLTPRQQQVIRLRFGLEDGCCHSLSEVATMTGWGVGRERIRQIEAKALRLLRHPSRSRRLQDYLS